MTIFPLVLIIVIGFFEIKNKLNKKFAYMKEFQWTDELVKEFAKTFDACDMGIHQFKQLKSEQKHYEILSVRSSEGDGWSCDKSKFEWYLNNRWTISQVKRLSDNEVFSIGDKVYFQKQSNPHLVIDNFYIRQDGVMLARGKDDNPVEIIDSDCYLKKANQPLFTTTDGVDIFEMQDYWRLNDEFCYYRVSNPNYRRGGSEKYFSTEEAAKEYILMNKPCLSLNDIKDWIEKYFHDSINISLLKPLVQQKINQ